MRNEGPGMMNELNEKIALAMTQQGDAIDAFIKRNEGTFHDLISRVEEIEAKGSGPGKTAQTREGMEHKNLFENWLRKPNDNATKNALGDFESKNVNIGTDAAGGFAVPEEIAREIERLELKFSPVRRLVRVMQTGSGDFKHLVNIGGTTSGWVSETGSRSETVTPSLRQITPTFGELYAYPQTTEWALDDVFFNVGNWLAEEVAQEFAKAEGAAVLTGDGSDKPTGLLNTTPVVTDDDASPLRAAAAYEFLPSLTLTSPAVAEIMPDELITLVYAVNSAYRANGTWIMNSSTGAAIRKLKDSNGAYLWQPSLIGGQPDRLLGYPVEFWEDMADTATNAFPVGFGDFRRGYLLVDRTQIRITVDANVTSPGKIKYFVRRRVGGMPLNNNAVKFLRTTIA